MVAGLPSSGFVPTFPEWSLCKAMPLPKHMNALRPEANLWHDKRRRWWWIECNAVRLPHVSFTGEKTLQYKVHNITVIAPFILAGMRWWRMSAQTGCAEECKYIDWQAGQPIVMLGPNILIGWTFYGPTSSTDNINTFIPLNLVIAIGMLRDFQPA